jgi:hypothetical protein
MIEIAIIAGSGGFAGGSPLYTSATYRSSAFLIEFLGKEGGDGVDGFDLVDSGCGDGNGGIAGRAEHEDVQDTLGIRLAVLGYEFDYRFVLIGSLDDFGRRSGMDTQ